MRSGMLCTCDAISHRQAWQYEAPLRRGFLVGAGKGRGSGRFDSGIFGLQMIDGDAGQAGFLTRQPEDRRAYTALDVLQAMYPISWPNLTRESRLREG